MMKQRCLALCLVELLVCVLILSSCTSITSTTMKTGTTINSRLSLDQLQMSTASFSLTNDTSQQDTLQSSHTTSKLRHGHQELTIEVDDARQSLIIAFIGYSGPATYSLINQINGGDVRVTSGEQFWDLALNPKLSCTLQILSDSLTQQMGIHRMRGNFSCPQLPSGPQNISSRPAILSNGRFDILIVVES
jgi:hypothetical protein